MVRSEARGRRLSKLSKGLGFVLGCVGSSEDLNMGGPTFPFHGGGRLTQRVCSAQGVTGNRTAFLEEGCLSSTLKKTVRGSEDL